MTDRDAATGLPALPEGYFFRVTSEAVQILTVDRPERVRVATLDTLKGDQSDADGTAYLGNRDPELFVVVVEKWQRGYYEWWGFIPEMFGKLRTVTEIVLYSREHQVAWSEPLFPDVEVLRESYSTRQHHADKLRATKVVTPPRVFGVATQAANQFHARLAEGDLFGDYPPKKMGTV